MPVCMLCNCVVQLIDNGTVALCTARLVLPLAAFGTLHDMDDTSMMSRTVLSGKLAPMVPLIPLHCCML
jgi:hypothetical protein